MHCPSITVFGTFFPSWMLSALVGLAGLLVLHRVLSLLRIDGHIGPRLVSYTAIALSISFLTWLGFYG